MHLLSQAEYRSAAWPRFPRSVRFYQACAGYYVVQSSTAVIPLNRLVDSLAIILERNYQGSIASARRATPVRLQVRCMAHLRSCDLNLGWSAKISLDYKPHAPAAGVPAYVADCFLNDPVYLNAIRLVQCQLLFQFVTRDELIFESLLLRQMRDGVAKRPFQRGEQAHIRQN